MSGNKKSNGTDGEGKVKQLGEVLTEKSRTCKRHTKQRDGMEKRTEERRGK